MAVTAELEIHIDMNMERNIKAEEDDVWTFEIGRTDVVRAKNVQ